VVRIARENPNWGYTRIRGALINLGYEIGRNTIKRILIEAGIDPAPERCKRMSWSTFLRALWGAIAATDFFTVEVLTLVGLVRYHVLFVIDLASRRVHVAGIVREPYDGWMRQIACNLTDAIDGFLIGHRHLIMDRAPVFTAGFRAMLAGSGVKSLRLPARRPNLNDLRARNIPQLIRAPHARRRRRVDDPAMARHFQRPLSSGEPQQAAVRVLEHLGYRVVIPERPLCCGRPLYDFGMLDVARDYLESTLSALKPFVDAGRR
jgi:hypothetical protein